MVRQLEPLVKSSGNTPEDQWKARILLRSGEEADHDIRKNMKRHEQSVRNIYDPNVRASHQKLNRDYNRAHDSFVTLLIQYNKNQEEVIAQFGGDQGWLSPEEVQKKMLAKHEVGLIDEIAHKDVRFSNSDALLLSLGGFLCARHAGARRRSQTHESKHASSEQYLFGKCNLRDQFKPKKNLSHFNPILLF